MYLLKKNKKILIVFLLVVFSFPAIFYLFNPGFFQSDDGEWMVIRFSAFYQALRDGQFPVRFLARLNNEYGYPVSNFLYPGFMYLGVPIHLLGFSFVETIKIILGLSMVSSCVFMYFWLNRIISKYAAFIGALFYLYAPYHLYDLYKRGSVGEVLALSIMPFILWNVERNSFMWTAFGIAFLILSHNTLAFLFFPILLIYMFLKITDVKNNSKNMRNLVYRYCVMILFGLGLSAFFWIPALYDLQYTVFSQTKISSWSEYFFNFNITGPVGVITILIVILFIFLGNKFDKSFFKKTNFTELKLIYFFLGVGVCSFFFSSEISKSVWNILPISFIQFPFRLLSIYILASAFLTGMLVHLISHSSKYIVGVILVILLFGMSFGYIKPDLLFNKEEGFYSTNLGTTTVKNEYMPKWVVNVPQELAKEKIYAKEGIISDSVITAKKIDFTIVASNKTKVTINRLYFPGWNAKINNISVPILYNNEKGIMELVVNKGKNIVHISFSETPVRLASDLISLGSLVTLLIIVLNQKKKFRLNFKKKVNK